MIFENNYLATIDWLRKNGCQYDGLPDDALIEELDQIAADCLRAYSPRPGDHELVGFFWFSSLSDQRKEGALKEDDNCHLDGLCFVGKGGKAAIGLSLELLGKSRGYARGGLVLHELAHLRHEEHDDNFVSFLLELQHRYFQNCREDGIAPKGLAFRCDTHPYSGFIP